mmetsp:Transcript_22363/g.40254  ORF Transcript_22363/g.40254 Transcript_22363/m.40254 type:complete len:471 (+) Transcript_22363:82-1494(+)|eukprot:CAMPEP_0197663356 /NCGR_PEP_ID=MMETSP1338-20131121/57112_1 /TAXON_ID=43686 ORGANISM="Pelagodinium beii, Strain RCC1491" /NCGR_SAMPLE_ID=MMETSP1338 /ASSEMBLY_ACC=CAM_ASM_000754 /LENGTH=470 /DNA_ID=CAMNT_0043241677 /DNA_START=82 /DNA_END=1494 /DNA_ORIENTATION=-
MAAFENGPAQSTLVLLKKMGHIVPWTLMASIGNGMVTPLGSYLALNFFAQRYTELPPEDIHCELDTMTPYCQKALMDGDMLVTALAVVMPFCQFVTLPLVGVLSDGIGRKRTLLITYCLSNLTLLFAVMFVFFNSSFWLCVVISPFVNAQLITAVLYAAVGDILDRPSRASGIGIITALDTIAYVIGLLLGLHTGLRNAYVVASGFALLSTAYLVCYFPETLPAHKRTFVIDRQSLLPWSSMPVLWRTPVLTRLSLACILAAFIDSGTARILPFYNQGRMSWSASNSYAFELGVDGSMIFWLTVLFNKILGLSGEIGALAFSRVATVIEIIPVTMATQPWQVCLCGALFGGPMSFSLPAIAGMKSRLVGEHEQGRMQAALSTIYVVSSSLGQIVFGTLFRSFGTEAAGKGPKMGQTIVASNVIFAVIILLIMQGLRSLMKQGDLEYTSITAETVAEDDFYGSTAANSNNA